MKRIAHGMAVILSALVGYLVKERIDRRIIQEQNELIETYDDMFLDQTEETCHEPPTDWKHMIRTAFHCEECKSLVFIVGTQEFADAQCHRLAECDEVECPQCGAYHVIDDFTRSVMEQ